MGTQTTVDPAPASIKVTIQRSVTTAVGVSLNVLRVAGMFGLGVDEGRVVEVVPEMELELAGGRVVFVTGPSGGGKSTILKLIKESVLAKGGRVVEFDQLPELADGPLVDVLEPATGSLEATLKLLSVAGLNDAFVMLRRPGELSDGQRYRLKLAQALAAPAPAPEGEGGQRGRLSVVLADEFGATLDRVTAGVIGRNVRKWVSRTLEGGSNLCFVAATTHDDLLEALEPDVVIEKHLGGRVGVYRR